MTHPLSHALTEKELQECERLIKIKEDAIANTKAIQDKIKSLEYNSIAA